MLGDFDMHRVVVGRLGPERNDRAIPPTIDAAGDRADTRGLATGSAAVQTMRESVHDIARRAVKAASGPGGRRHYPPGQLVPGQSWVPTVRAVLRAADRPLTSAEVAVAFLEARGVSLTGPEIKAVVSRVSALISREADRGRVERIAASMDQKQKWVWVRPAEEAEAPETDQASRGGSR